MSAFVLLQTLLLSSDNSDILKYQNITQIPAFVFLFIIIIISLFILQKSTIEVPLVADNNINKINPLFRIFAAAKYLIFGTSLDE